MKGKMKVAIMTDVAKVELTEREIPKPAANEVLVRVEYVGVCGSDIHRQSDIICVLKLSFLPRRLWMVFFRNMWRMKQICALKYRTIWIPWKQH